MAASIKVDWKWFVQVGGVETLTFTGESAGAVGIGNALITTASQDTGCNKGVTFAVKTVPSVAMALPLVKSTVTLALGCQL